MLKKIKNKIIEIKNKRKTKWKVCLYYRCQYIGYQWINENDKPMTLFYIVKVKNRRHLFGTNKKVQLIMNPIKYKLTNEEKREVHIEVVPWEGVNLND